jgi:predicted XRE-type DNA-binding protein
MRKPAVKLDVVYGSGNLYRDLGNLDSDVRQLKAILAAEIVKLLDQDALTVRKAQERTGVDAGDFARIRNAKLERFTVDRLMGIVNKLGARVDLSLKIRRGTRRLAPASP